MTARTIVLQEAPVHLQKLKADTQAQWGTMNAVQMLQHLQLALQMSISGQALTITTPADKIARLQAFILSSAPFARVLPQPAYFNASAESGDFAPARQSLIAGIEAMGQHFDQNPDFTSVHPAFGRLDQKLWWHLHAKHFKHHFEQFNLINR